MFVFAKLKKECSKIDYIAYIKKRETLKDSNDVDLKG